ncbi:STAS domain-containing protein [Mycolicibacterium litorale]|uniref:STAS domain-containing protein n=1 Tax=Mycolicibacterium litorale TaxID=758802 RepID=UPI0010669320|nr:STAS domain-containing protein [Mycolicibacterium litorale]MCV7417605.1 STAS domain-containing protein [Mycolicibacterium litorale]
MDGQNIDAEQWHGQVAVVRATGAVDMLTAPRLQAAIRAAHRKQPTGLIVDLSDAQFLSSAGMHVLITTHDEVTPATRFAVVAEGPGTSRPLKITGLTDFIELFSTLDTALNTFAE